MPEPLRPSDASTHAPLQARIAGVAMMTTVIALMAVFTVLRNLTGSWLAP